MTDQENPESPSELEKKIVYEWSMQKMTDYVTPRVTTATVAAAVLGASKSYYVQGTVFLGLYSSALTGGIASLSFFGTKHLLETVRQKDDNLNFGAAGGITGAFMGGFQNGNRGRVIGLVSGSVAGIAFYYLSGALYNFSRENYIATRRRTLERGQPRTLNPRIPRNDPRHLEEGPQIPYPRPEPFRPEPKK